MKKIFCILFFFTSLLFSQVNNVYVYGNGSYNSHDSTVAWSFIQGYESTGGTWSGTLNYSDKNYSVTTAKDSAYQIYIYSYTGISGLISTAQTNYPNILVLGATGSNSHVQVYNSSGSLPCIVSTGGGDTNNETGYDIEFFSNDPTNTNPDLSSFSNGYIAGQLAYIANQRSSTLWEARYCGRETSSRNTWVNTDGYGKINIDSAIAYQGTIPTDPYLIVEDPPNTEEPPPNETPLILGTAPTVSKSILNDKVYLTWAATTNANHYKVFRNFHSVWTEIDSTISTSSTDETITRSEQHYSYKVIAYLNDETAESASIDVPFIKIVKFYYKKGN